MFYLTTHSTHFIYGYMASDMVKNHWDSESGNPLPPNELLFPISSKGSFIFHRQDSTYRSRGSLAGTKNSSMSSPWRINPTTHHTLRERSCHGATSCSKIRTTLWSGVEIRTPYLQAFFLRWLRHSATEADFFFLYWDLIVKFLCENNFHSCLLIDSSS